jgi:hypothetical protein
VENAWPRLFAGTGKLNFGRFADMYYLPCNDFPC